MNIKNLPTAGNMLVNIVTFSFLLLSLFNLQGCSKKVIPNLKDDISPPSVGLLVVTDKEVLSVGDSDSPKTVYVKSGSTLPVVFNTSDPGGAKYAKLIVISGGLFKNTSGDSTTNYTAKNTIENGETSRMLNVSGTILPDSVSSQVILYAEGSDWAGNISKTPPITIIQLTPPVAHISASDRLIDYGKNVTITYETHNADAVTINDVLQSSSSGSQTYQLRSTSTYNLKATNGLGSATDSTTVSVNPAPPAPPTGPTCFQTDENSGDIWFYLITYDEQGPIWGLNMTSTSMSGTIRTISSSTDRDFNLTVGGRGDRLVQGETSEAFRGVAVKSFYTADFENDIDNPVSRVAITVCYDKD